MLAVLTGSVGLLGDTIHNLSDVSASAVVFLGFRLSRRPPTDRYSYGPDRAEDLAGIGTAAVISVSAAFADAEGIHHHRCRRGHRRCGHRDPVRALPAASANIAAAVKAVQVIPGTLCPGRYPVTSTRTDWIVR